MSREEPFSESLRRELHEIAAADAPQLLAQARERARIRAEALLEDALVQELIAAASRLRDASVSETRSARTVRAAAEPNAPPGSRAAPKAPPDPGARRAFEARSTDDGQVWWTYCVASAEDITSRPSELEGIEPETQVQVVREGPLAALVSPVPSAEYGDERLREHLEDLRWLEHTARRHEAVLEAALQDVTIVPLRLCTLYRDVDGVRGFLRDYEDPLIEGLTRVQGCTEWGVKVFAEARAGSSGPDTSPGTSERSGAAYLQQRQQERALAERASEVRAKCAEAIHRRMRELAREAASNPPQRPGVHGRELRMLLNGAYLVERGRDEELARAVETLREEWEPLGFVIELTGPWPPYNFVAGATGVMP